jgi:putative cardiolipin synthase
MKFPRPLLLGLLLGLQAACTSIPRRPPDWEASGPFTHSAPPVAERGDPIPSAYQDRAESDKPVHHLQLLETGDDAFIARIHLFRAAREQIDIQSYIWRQDGVTRVLWDELMDAADRGVRVRILVDAFPPMGEASLLAKKAFAHEGIEIRLFNPPFAEASERTLGQLRSLPFRFRRINQRMHHKLTLIDGEIAIVGGRNIEDKYFDRRDDFVYKDRELVVIGRVLGEIQETFNVFWEHRRSVPLPLFRDVASYLLHAPRIPRPLADEDDRQLTADILPLAETHDLAGLDPRLRWFETANGVEFLTDSPLRFTRRRYRAKHYEIRELMRETENELLFQSPYLIWDRQFNRDLRRIRRQHPELSTVFSTNSLAAADHPFVYAISFKHRKLLFRRMQLDIHQFMPFPSHREEIVPRIARDPEFNPRIGLHAKSMVVDRRTALVSTHNFDPRSANINSECGIVVRDPEFAEHLAGLILADTAPENSWVVGRRQNRPPLIHRISDSLAYSFMVLPVPDIWPHSYTSVFQLREGMEPVPPRHPEFHERFEDVGLFPGLDDRAVRRQVKLIRAMGGWTRPLL